MSTDGFKYPNHHLILLQANLTRKTFMHLMQSPMNLHSRFTSKKFGQYEGTSTQFTQHQ